MLEYGCWRTWWRARAAKFIAMVCANVIGTTMTKTWLQRWGRFYISGLERDESGSLTAIAGLMQRMVKSTTLA